MIIGAIIATSVAWYIGGVLGAHSDSAMGISLSTLFAILTMGAFILEAIRKGNKIN